jgi:hypothetical protein
MGVTKNMFYKHIYFRARLLNQVVLFLWVLYCRIVPQTSSSHSAHAQEWWDMSPEGEARSWEGEVPDPLRPGPRSPLLRIPGISFESCQPDVLHVFNLGVGADMAIGGILAIFRMGLWGGSTIGAALNNAYERFRQWCVRHRQTPFIKSFDLGKFHMSSCLGLMGYTLTSFRWNVFKLYDAFFP